MSLNVSINNMQKVEFKADATKCNVSFKNYKSGSTNTLLITDVPAGAGTMLGAAYSAAFFIQPGFNQAPPIVFAEFNDANVVNNGAGAGIDSVKYGGRIELREFV